MSCSMRTAIVAVLRCPGAGTGLQISCTRWPRFLTIFHSLAECAASAVCSFPKGARRTRRAPCPACTPRASHAPRPGCIRSAQARAAPCLPTALPARFLTRERPSFACRLRTRPARSASVRGSSRRWLYLRGSSRGGRGSAGGATRRERLGAASLGIEHVRAGALFATARSAQDEPGRSGYPRDHIHTRRYQKICGSGSISGKIVEDRWRLVGDRARFWEIVGD